MSRKSGTATGDVDLLIKQIKRRMEFLEISQRGLAEDLGVSTVHLCNVLGGHCPQVSVAFVAKLAGKLGLRLVLILENRSDGKKTAKAVRSMRSKELARSDRA